MISEAIIGTEALAMAVEMEKKARRCYEYMANRGNGLADRFRRLRAEEEQHEKMLRDMLGRLGGYRRPQIYPSWYYQCIRDLADHVALADEILQEALAQHEISDSRALEISIALERDTISFYSSMRSVFPVADDEVMQKVTSDEISHLQELQDVWVSQSKIADSAANCCSLASPVGDARLPEHDAVVLGCPT